ncbi:hypothetical protein K440DRAFT_623116 [Wilcoxina mikolae CBS 423.85]|nr:hypothetical protein K440DRAFT_623116 [Wilcoxina mikolae CBS 423.85]
MWSIGLWHFFPVYVSLIRRVLRRVVGGGHQHHAESSVPSVVRLYALPVVLSVVCHVNLVLMVLRGREDDSDETTVATLRFMRINFLGVVATMVYWIVIEGGWRVAGYAVLGGVVAGPGAGVAVGWVLKERSMVKEERGEAREEEREEEREERPLLDNGDASEGVEG